MLRPTQDRVREALFSSLAALLPGASFLDLYAGTGSVGIEAWSRGAGSVCWVEQDRRAFRVLRENIDALSEASSSCKVLPCCMAVEAFCQRASGGPFDVIFADPPYGRNRSHEGDIAAVFMKATLLKPRGILVLEQAVGDCMPAVCEEVWQLLRERRYGSSQLRYFQMKGKA